MRKKERAKMKCHQDKNVGLLTEFKSVKVNLCEM